MCVTLLSFFPQLDFFFQSHIHFFSVMNMKNLSKLYEKQTKWNYRSSASAKFNRCNYSKHGEAHVVLVNSLGQHNLPYCCGLLTQATRKPNALRELHGVEIGIWSGGDVVPKWGNSLQNTEQPHGLFQNECGLSAKITEATKYLPKLAQCSLGAGGKASIPGMLNINKQTDEL